MQILKRIWPSLLAAFVAGLMLSSISACVSRKHPSAKECLSQQIPNPSQKPSKLRKDECKSKSIPVAQAPKLGGTTWSGINFDGEPYEITFHVEGHVGKGFTLKTPTKIIEGYGFYFAGRPEFNERIGVTTYPFAIEFLMNYARLRAKICVEENQITFEDTAPLVIGVDYKALLGDSYKGRHSITELIECAGKSVGAFVVFETDARKVRESFEGGLLYEKDERPTKPGPYGLGDAAYYKWVPWPHHVPELHFIRKNVLVYFPSGYVDCTPEQEKRIYEVAYLLDAAIRDESSAVTVIRMPKTLQKVGTSAN